MKHVFNITRINTEDLETEILSFFHKNIFCASGFVGNFVKAI